MALLKEYKLGMDYTAKTFAGLEEVLAKELNEIGADDVEIIKRGVKFRGDEKILYKANYLCRTALRILKPVGVFDVKDEKQLYEKVKSVDWSKVFNLEQTFLVNSTLFHSELTHSHYVSLKTKDAIVDQFRDKTGKRPWVGKEGADIYVDVHISQNVCTLSLDASGDSLHRRGYRIDADKAPLNEVLAAGMIKLTGWNGEKDFYDPMCGSGTIPIEAAMLAMNIPAGHYRKQFAFMNWANYNEELFKEVKDKAGLEMKELECNIIASDRSEKAIGIAKRNLRSTGLHKDIELRNKYFDSIIPEEKNGILVFNPPYGKRLEEKGEIIGLYKGIGDVLKQNFGGFEAWVISGNLEATKFIGLRPSARITLFNGPIEAKFVKFELYEGSKRDQYENKDGERKEYPKRDDDKKKEFRPRDEGDRKSFRKRDDGERKPFQKRDDGERKPFKRREDDERKPYRKRDEEGKKDFQKRDDGERKPFQKREDSERKPFKRREDDERKPYRKNDDVEKKPFRKRDDGERKPFEKREDDGKRDYRKREDGDKSDFRPRDGGDKKSFRKRGDGERKPFRKHEDGKRRRFKIRDGDGQKNYLNKDGFKKDSHKPSDENPKKDSENPGEDDSKRGPRKDSEPNEDS